MGIGEKNKKDCGVQCEMSRSIQFYIMLSLLNEGAITMDDLEDFSDDLKEIIQHFAGILLAVKHIFLGREQSRI